MLSGNNSHVEQNVVDDGFVIVNKYTLTDLSKEYVGTVEEDGWFYIEAADEAKKEVDTVPAETGDPRSVTPLAFIVKDPDTLKDLLETIAKDHHANIFIKDALQRADRIIYHPHLPPTQVILAQANDHSTIKDDTNKQLNSNEMINAAKNMVGIAKNHLYQDLSYVYQAGANALAQARSVYQQALKTGKTCFTISIQGVAVTCRVINGALKVVSALTLDGKDIVASVSELLANLTGLKTIRALGDLTDEILEDAHKVIEVIRDALKTVQDTANGIVNHQILNQLLAFTEGPQTKQGRAKALLIANITLFHELNCLTTYSDNEIKEEGDILVGAPINNDEWQKMLKEGYALQKKLNEEIAEASRPLTNVGIPVSDTEEYEGKRNALQPLCKLAQEIAKNLNQLKDSPSNSDVIFKQVNEKIDELNELAGKGKPTLGKTLAKNWGQMVQKIALGLFIGAVITTVAILTGGIGLLTMTAGLMIGTGSALGALAGLGWGISDANRSHRKDQEEWEGSVECSATLFARSAKQVIINAKGQPDPEALRGRISLPVS